MTDRELLHQGCTNHSDEAFNELYERYNNKVKRLLFFLKLANQNTIDDILQQFWLKVYRKASQCKINVDVWLFQIAKSIAIDYMIVEKRQTIYFVGGLTDWLKDILSIDLRTHHVISQPPQGAIRKEIRERVRKSLECLTVNQRYAIVSVYLQGMPVHEAAELLGVAPSTIRNHILHAKYKLRGNLKSIL